MVRPQQSRLKSRRYFLSSVRPADFHPKAIRCNEWQHRINTKTQAAVPTSPREYVQALRAARNSGRSGANMKEILHASVVSHQRTLDICWNARSLHIPALWMTFYSSTKSETVCRTKEDNGLMT